MEKALPKISSLDHYKALLLLYASHADLFYSDSERKYIIDSVGLEITEEVERFYNDKSEYEILAFLVNNRKRFMPGNTGQEEAMALLKELFKVDGDYSRIEFNSFQFLEKMFYSDGPSDIEP